MLSRINPVLSIDWYWTWVMKYVCYSAWGTDHLHIFHVVFIHISNSKFWFWQLLDVRASENKQKTCPSLCLQLLLVTFQWRTAIGLFMLLENFLKSHSCAVHRVICCCRKKSFKLVWRCYQFFSGFLVNDHLLRMSRLSANDKDDNQGPDYDGLNIL